ncbi:MAG: cell division protein ZapA [Acidobacteriota bacterium]|nr:cell division protein ZapA [Acidobacteriota bacterium]
MTTVKIFKQTYQVRSGDDPEYIKRLAKYVDETMTDVFESTPSVDSIKVAVLAALNIADEYFSTKDELDRLEEAVSEKSEKLITLLDPLTDTKSS